MAMSGKLGYDASDTFLKYPSFPDRSGWNVRL
jgi:hypothetical protein